MRILRWPQEINEFSVRDKKTKLQHFAVLFYFNSLYFRNYVFPVIDFILWYTTCNYVWNTIREYVRTRAYTVTLAQFNMLHVLLI